jgi:hypothetical protein
MSIPRDHHYLPQFYLENWARDGHVYRYLRPRGPDGPLDCKRKTPKAIAYERDLYHLPDVDEPAQSQALELQFFQKIDARAAVALRKLDQGMHGSAHDRVALSQFMISLLHRSPSRLRAIRDELATRIEGAPYEGLEGEQFERAVKATANRLLAMLVESHDSTARISRFKAFRIEVGGTQNTLLTSDRPLTLSAQLIAPDAFMMMPYAPDRLVILTHMKEIADAFSSQDPDVLVDGINQAVVEQSQDIVVAADKRSAEMIDRLFMRPAPDRVLDPIGLIRRRSPYVDLRPRVRTFSRHNKKAMKYLGA